MTSTGSLKASGSAKSLKFNHAGLGCQGSLSVTLELKVAREELPSAPALRTDKSRSRSGFEEAAGTVTGTVRALSGYAAWEVERSWNAVPIEAKTVLKFALAAAVVGAVLPSVRRLLRPDSLRQVFTRKHD